MSVTLVGHNFTDNMANVLCLNYIHTNKVCPGTFCLLFDYFEFGPLCHLLSFSDMFFVYFKSWEVYFWMVIY